MGSWWVGYEYFLSDPPLTHDPYSRLTDIISLDQESGASLNYVMLNCMIQTLYMT